MSSKVVEFLEKSKSWQKEMAKLRSIVLETGLDESLKWGKPCYSHNENNIVIFQPFKNCLSMMFFKGTLLKDTKGLLINNGPNSQAGRRLEFASVSDIVKLKPTIKAYIKDAIAIEESGQKVKFSKKPQSEPQELKSMLARDPRLKEAFHSLTPGRQRAYILHFSSAKQSSTRVSRIEKCVPRILEGKGMTDP